MAAETLYADGVIAGNGFTNAANAVGSTAATWAGDLNVNSNYSGRWSMADPSRGLAGVQTVAVQARKGSNSGTPTIGINVYVDGVLTASRTAVNITSTVGQLVSVTFTAAEMSPPLNVDVEVVQTSAGGSPSARNSAQIDFIRWTAELEAPQQNLVIQDAGVSPSVDSVVLAQVHQLTVADASVLSAADGITLTQVHQLVLADASVAAAMDALTLQQVINSDLLVADAVVQSTAESPDVTVAHLLVVQDAASAPAADGLVVAQDHYLLVQDAGVAVAADSLVLGQAHAIVINEAGVASTIDGVSLGVIQALTVDDATVVPAADLIVFPNGMPLIRMADGTWKQKPVYIWNGTEWKLGVVKRWTGSEWVVV